MRLVRDPFVDALRSCRGIGNEIDRLKCPAEILFHQRQKSLAKRIALLCKQPVRDVQRDRFTRPTKSFGLFYKLSRLRTHLFQRMLKGGKRGRHTAIVSEMQKTW